MALAAQAGSPVKRMVLNDVGPVITQGFARTDRLLRRQGAELSSVEEAEQLHSHDLGAFGPHSDAQWRFLTETWLRRNDDGSWRAHYDPRIGELAPGPQNDLELWALYDAVRCPTLVLRGELSDLLTRETAAEMTRRARRRRWWRSAALATPRRCCIRTRSPLVRDFLLQGD